MFQTWVQGKLFSSLFKELMLMLLIIGPLLLEIQKQIKLFVSGSESQAIGGI
jgi:hypothetical protein